MLLADTKAGGVIPVIGFGTWGLLGKECIKSVKYALETGYRHIDTAQVYDNEKDVGEGIRDGKIQRKEIFLTTKIATRDLIPSMVQPSVKQSLKRLRTRYVDLLLLHWPTKDMDLKAILGELSELKEKGVVKNIGVSNFSPGLFEEALQYADIVTNQVEFNPFHSDFENLKMARNRKKSLTAYSPLAKGEVPEDNEIKELAMKYGKSASQVVLRWLVQLRDIAVIPKAREKAHIKENFDIFNIKLSEDDMGILNNWSSRR